MTNIIAEFVVYGDNLDPVRVTETLGLFPNKTWVRGDIKNRRTNSTYGYGCWKICTNANDLSLECHVHILIDRLSSCKDMIRAFAIDNGYTIEVSAIVRISEESPDISLSKESIEWICSIGASLDIDIYLYDDVAK